MAKLRNCRTWIKEWCTNEFYSIKGHKSKLMDEIKEIDFEEEKGVLNTDTAKRREELKANLLGVLKEALWRTRAK